MMSTDVFTESDFRRFTQQQHARGETAGWRFEAGWFVRMSGLNWAWFSREIDDGHTHEP